MPHCLFISFHINADEIKSVFLLINPSFSLPSLTAQWQSYTVLFLVFTSVFRSVDLGDIFHIPDLICRLSSAYLDRRSTPRRYLVYAKSKNTRGKSSCVFENENWNPKYTILSSILAVNRMTTTRAQASKRAGA